jgi:hypothetical protein
MISSGWVWIFFVVSWFASIPLASTLSEISAIQAVRGVEIQRVPLRYGLEGSPFCFAASSLSTLPPKSNFLATQVWPAARVASMAVQQHSHLFHDGGDSDDTTNTTRGTRSGAWRKICEFGCGPGLPSLTAAATLHSRYTASKTENSDHLDWSVYATDLDGFALDLVQAAAQEQSLDKNLMTHQIDLLQDPKTYASILQDLDLAILSDVFENRDVAMGAATFTEYLLKQQTNVWVFCQSDRSQRDAFIDKLRELLVEPNLEFSNDTHEEGDRLWLCNVDETKVVY